MSWLRTNNVFSSGHFVADVNVAIRKIATLLKPDKDIVHEGDHIIIKTLSTFKNYNMDFYVGKEFEEDLSGVDDRKCMVSTDVTQCEVSDLKCRGRVTDISLNVFILVVAEICFQPFDPPM